MRYEVLKHTADVKFRAYGNTINKAFENSAIAMFKTMYEKNVRAKTKKNLTAKGKDLESLLYNFLEELLVLLDGKNFFLSKVNLKINEDDFSLNAVVYGDDAGNYEIVQHVKEVTSKNMSVKKIKDRWICQVVLDV